jgi:16S rRNA (adenine1518-N6/adenine1519-N6)-dimethyltransferase
MQYTLKKQLGQHFLHDESVCMHIVESLKPNIKNLLEIGPGGGALTKYLMYLPVANYQCIELDKEKIDYLVENDYVEEAFLSNYSFERGQILSSYHFASE